MYAGLTTFCENFNYPTSSTGRIIIFYHPKNKSYVLKKRACIGDAMKTKEFFNTFINNNSAFESIGHEYKGLLGVLEV